MLGCRRTGRIEETWLCDEDKGSLGDLSLPGCTFSSSHLYKSAPKMNSACLSTPRGRPRNWAFESPIEFERSDAIPILLKFPPIGERKVRAGNL
jgi:hypothetical protein